MKRRNYAYHPACLLFPRLPQEELQALADDIRQNGLQNPIVLYHGKILDGRNRRIACGIAGVEPRYVEWDGEGSPVSWVVSENLVRRHLSSSQRAVIASGLLPLLESEAKGRQRRSQGRGKKVGKELPTFSENGKATEVAARVAHTNRNYVQAVKTIAADAPEVIEEIRSGRLTVPEARLLASAAPAIRRKVLQELDGQPHGRIARLIRQEQIASRRAAARRFVGTNGSTVSHDILHGDMGLLWKRLKDSSVKMFFADPIYGDTEAYGRLAELAAAKLVPGGLCLAYTGQFHLPEVMAAMAKHLTYWWTFAIQFAGSHCAVHARRVQNKWKPILAFAKPPLKPSPDWVVDLLQGGGRDKEYHAWGQSESEVGYLLRLFTDPNDLVVDPFCGGGTIPAACKATGRRWLATDVDKGTVALARKRLADMDRSSPAAPSRRGEVEVWHGDCLDLMPKRIADRSVSAVVTSPVYNLGIRYNTYQDDRPMDEYLSWLGKVFQEIHRVLADYGSFFLNVGSSRSQPWNARKVAEVAGRHFVLQNEIVWAKAITMDGQSQGHFTPVPGDRFLNHNFESVFHFTKSGKVAIDRLALGVPYEYESNLLRRRVKPNVRCAGDVWFVPYETMQDGSDRGHHPATFPVEIARRCIKLAGIRKDTVVLDPFSGIGSTLSACQSLGVKGIGIDIDAAYCKQARKRLGV